VTSYGFWGLSAGRDIERRESANDGLIGLCDDVDRLDASDAGGYEVVQVVGGENGRHVLVRREKTIRKRSQDGTELNYKYLRPEIGLPPTPWICPSQLIINNILS
jgi:hypothetical protein